jgi:AcrR family transcriptional regulator
MADLDLDRDRIVAAAIEILNERGLDAVTMRNVAERLGVSPMPLYTRVGNKGALLAAVSERLLADLAPTPVPSEGWPEYATRWCRHLRARLALAPDSRLYLGSDRDAYVAASVPLVAVLRAGGLAPGAAVRACRLLMWGTVGFVAMEQGSASPSGSPEAPTGRVRRRGRRPPVPGGDPTGVSPEEADELFDIHIGFIVAGLERLHAG